MGDIAQLGFSVDTGDLNKAKASLEALAPAAKSAAQSSDTATNSLTKLDLAAGKVSNDLKQTKLSVEGFATGVGAMSPALKASAEGVALNSTAMRELLVVARELGRGNLTRLPGSLSILIPQLTTLSASGVTFGTVLKGMAMQFGILKTSIDPALGVYGELAVADAAAAMAMRNSVAAMAEKAQASILAADTELALANAAVAVADTSTAAALAQERLALANEAVGVASAEAAIADAALAEANVAVASTAEAAAAAEMTALSPLAVVVLGIVAALATLASMFKLGANQINQSSGDIADGMGLTEKQIQRLQKSGTDTFVTMGDTMHAFFDVLGQRIESSTGLFSTMKKYWQDAMDFIAKYGEMGIALYIGAWGAAIAGIKAMWQNLPETIGFLVIAGANITISTIESMINSAIGLINGLINLANPVLEKAGVAKIGLLGDVDIKRLANPYHDAGVAMGEALFKGFEQGYQGTYKFFTDVGNRARAIRRDKIDDADGDPGKDKKGRAAKADPWAALVKGAENDISGELSKTAQAGLELTAEATATLVEKTKLLNEAHSKGINLTAEQSAKIDELAAAYGKAKVAADNAKGIRDVMNTSEADIAKLNEEIKMVGLYGHQLAYATEMAKLLAEAKSKNMTPEAIAAATPQFQAQANKVADASGALDSAKFTEENKQASAQQIASMQRERGEIGLTGAALIAYQKESELLLQARQKHIDLTPEEINAIHQQAQAYGQMRDELDKTKEAIAFAKDVVKGFFTDLVTNIRQGQNIWDALGNAALNALNKIIDKLLDKTLNSLLDQLFSGGGSGGASGGGFIGMLASIFANGGAFGSGGIMPFASGGAFTNGVVSSPTLFAFANGGALGVMGEAGPEAIMPLHRGSDGSLGVRMSDAGTGGQNGPASVNVNVTNNHTVSGAISSQDIIDLQKRSAQQTMGEVKRQLTGWIGQIQHDGAVV